MPANTPIVGLPYPVGTDPVRDGDNQIRSLAEAVDQRLGLIKIIPTSVAGTGVTVDARGNVSLAATPAAGATINGVFTSTWQNYRVVFTALGTSATTVLVNCRLALAGTPAATGVYVRSKITTTEAAGPTRTYLATATEFNFGSVMNTYAHAQMDISQPAQARQTILMSTFAAYGGTNNEQGTAWCNHNLATAYDGLYVFPASGTMTGTIRIYAYGE